MPEYSGDFRCIAGKCTDNCCIGWGIYIDDKTAELYRSIGGEFGEKLRRSIDFEEQCFRNGADSRCPFLNGENLCDIILNMGEGALCDICDRHPRYFEWFDDCIEGGIGLCCETAAELILGAESFSVSRTGAPERLLSEIGDDPCDQQYTAFLRTVREKLICRLTDASHPLADTLRSLLTYGRELQRLTDEYEIGSVPEFEAAPDIPDPQEIADLLASLEPEDSVRKQFRDDLAEYIRRTPDALIPSPEDDRELRNTAVYFLWRYLMKAVFSGQIYTKLYLAVFGTLVIAAAFRRERELRGCLNFGEKCAIAVTISKLAEYSEDNIYLIYEQGAIE